MTGKRKREGRKVCEEQRDRQTLSYVGLLIKKECTKWNGRPFTVAFEGEGCVKWSGEGGGIRGRRGKEKQLRFTLVLG